MKFIIAIFMMMTSLLTQAMDSRQDDNAYYVRNSIRHSGKITLKTHEKKTCTESFTGEFQDSFTGEIFLYSHFTKSCGWVGPVAVTSETVQIPNIGTFPVYHSVSATLECSACHGEAVLSRQCRGQCGCTTIFCGSW
jgi:hypothetical protein